MPPKKKTTTKKPSTKVSAKPVRELSTAETMEHYNAVLVESLKSEFRLAFEKIDGLDEKITGLQAHVNGLDANMGMVRVEVGCMQMAFSTLDTKVNGLQMQYSRLDKKMDLMVDQLKIHEDQLRETNAHLTNHDKQFEEIKEGLAEISSKADHQNEQINRHERDIEILKTHL